ncbi:MAG: hypothetical protein AAFQ52_16335, partial [Chloroflexota bacterium]
GDVLIGLDDIDSARETLQDALDTARAINATQPLLRTLMWFGKLQSLAGNDTVAATLWSYVNLHDSCDMETRNDSERLLSEMSETVSAEVLANAIRDSEKQTLDSIIALSQ